MLSIYFLLLFVVLFVCALYFCINDDFVIDSSSVWSQYVYKLLNGTDLKNFYFLKRLGASSVR